MSHFTLVINDVSPDEFEKLIEVQTHAHRELKFVPQGNQPNQPPSMVGSPGMTTNPQTGALTPVRFEWDANGVEAALKLLHVFHKKPETPLESKQ